MVGLRNRCLNVSPIPLATSMMAFNISHPRIGDCRTILSEERGTTRRYGQEPNGQVPPGQDAGPPGKLHESISHGLFAPVPVAKTDNSRLTDVSPQDGQTGTSFSDRINSSNRSPQRLHVNSKRGINLHLPKEYRVDSRTAKLPWPSQNPESSAYPPRLMEIQSGVDCIRPAKPTPAFPPHIKSAFETLPEASPPIIRSFSDSRRLFAIHRSA